MKKIALLFGALIMGFMITSCGNKKAETLNLFNTFFDEEVSLLNKVEDADGWMAYYEAASERFNDFFDMLNKEIPLDENDNIVGLSKTESDEVMNAYDNRMDDYLAKREAKGSALYEPFISDLESSFNDVLNMLNQYENVEAIPDEQFNPVYDKLVEKFDLADQYVMLSDDSQYDRYLAIYDQLFGDEEGSEE